MTTNDRLAVIMRHLALPESARELLIVHLEGSKAAGMVDSDKFWHKVRDEAAAIQEEVKDYRAKAIYWEGECTEARRGEGERIAAAVSDARREWEEKLNQSSSSTDRHYERICELETELESAAADKQQAIDEALAAAEERHKSAKERIRQHWQDRELQFQKEFATDKQKAVDANDAMWKVHYERAAKESERQHAEALAAERLRGEQALSLERRNWEAYREGEQGRIETAVNTQKEACIAVLEKEAREIDSRHPAVMMLGRLIRKMERAKASPTDSPRDMTREETVGACLKRSDEPALLIPFSFYVGQISEHV